MKIFPLLLIAALAFGCSSEPSSDNLSRYICYDRVIPADKQVVAAAWIVNALQAAKSPVDKEPEDYIVAVRATAFELFGRPTIGIRGVSGGSSAFVPYDQLSINDKMWCDQYLANASPAVPAEKAP